MAPFNHLESWKKISNKIHIPSTNTISFKWLGVGTLPLYGDWVQLNMLNYWYSSTKVSLRCITRSRLLINK
jgi:hypothetical protein